MDPVSSIASISTKVPKFLTISIWNFTLSRKYISLCLSMTTKIPSAFVSNSFNVGSGADLKRIISDCFGPSLFSRL